MPGELDYDQVQEYMEALVPPRPPELAVMEEDARRDGFPIIGPVAGQACYLIARLLKARRVFEMGSGYGYSTAWFARAVQENCAEESTGSNDSNSSSTSSASSASRGGEVHHVVWDADLSQRARRHLAALGYADLIHYHVGEAVGELRKSTGPFDIVFNDIDKDGYPGALPAIAEKLRPGGVLIIDNMLWHGRIFQPADRAPATLGVHEVTRLLTTDSAWVVSLLPLRDGLIVAQRR
jgi:predicted O-methyltransferase YrrM